MAYSILTRWRNITDIPVSEIADADVRTDYTTPALARFNGIMGLTDTITTDTTGNTHKDEAIAWLAASMYHSGQYTTKRDESRGGLFIWEVWEQQAYKTMAEIDATKFDYNKGTGVYTVHSRPEVWMNALSYEDGTEETVYGI